MLRTMCKIDDEDEIKKLMKKLAPYLRSKMRPFLFIGGENNFITRKNKVAINKMMRELKVESSTIETT